jgi:hypothetical protein
VRNIGRFGHDGDEHDRRAQHEDSGEPDELGSISLPPGPDREWRLRLAVGAQRMIETGGRRVGSAFRVQVLGEPLGGQPDFFNGLERLGRLDQHGLEDRAFGGIELAEHEGSHPGIVGIDGHG